MAGLTNNYSMTPGVCSLTGETVYNKSSCQSLRVYPTPPGFWEESICLPIRGDGPEVKKQRDAMYRGMMFGDITFVSCRHPDCWICMGQKTHPTVEQIAAFKPPAEGKRWGVLSGEEWLFKPGERK